MSPFLTSPCFHPGLHTLLIVCFSAGAIAARGQNLVQNAGFETGDEGWGLYCGKEAEEAGAAVAASSEAARSGNFSLKLSSRGSARYSAGPWLGQSGVVNPGDRFRLSLWVLAGNDFVPDPGSHGFVVRATLRGADRTDSLEGHYFFKPPARAVRAKYTESRGALGSHVVEHAWRELSVVFEIPADIRYLGLNLFVEKGSGALFVDDVSLTKVDASVPLTPLLGGTP